MSSKRSKLASSSTASIHSLIGVSILLWDDNERFIKLHLYGLQNCTLFKYFWPLAPVQFPISLAILCKVMKPPSRTQCFINYEIVIQHPYPNLLPKAEQLLIWTICCHHIVHMHICSQLHMAAVQGPYTKKRLNHESGTVLERMESFLFFHAAINGILYNTDMPNS